MEEQSSKLFVYVISFTLTKMCFALPYKVLDISGNIATVTGGKKVLLGTDIKVKKGEYLRVTGNVAVSRLSRKQAEKINAMIYNMNVKSKL